jgi:hypothetical protein
MDGVGTKTEKAALLRLLDREFERLWDALELVCPGGRERPDVVDQRSVKDLIANLWEWDQAFLTCVDARGAGDARQGPLPPPDIDLRAVEESWLEVVDRFCESHERVRAVIERLDDAELAAPCPRALGGDPSLAECAHRSGPERYRWATRAVLDWVARPRTATEVA